MGKILTPIEPEEDNNNNTNMIVSNQQHLHSTMYQLLHTAVGGIGDHRVFDYEDMLTYISNEDGVMLAVEDYF